MGDRVIMYRICDKCTKETSATVTDKISLNGHRYDIDLCDQHSAELYGLMMKWADAGTKTGEPTVFEKQRRFEPAPGSAPQPAPAAAEPAPAKAAKKTKVIRPLELPHTAERWTITTHAEARMKLRGFTRHEVLMAAECPEMVQPAMLMRGRQRTEATEHKRGRCLAVVAKDSPTILTVKIAARGTYDESVAPQAQAR